MAETGNMDFLKNLQESLETGEKNDEIVDHLNEIDKKADELTFQDAAEKMDKRIEEAEPLKEMSEEERKVAEEEYSKVLAEQKENDAKLAFLANIETRNAEIKGLVAEFETKKERYSKLIAEIQEIKVNLMAEFELKYGTKAEDEFDFGPEPDTDLK